MINRTSKYIFFFLFSFAATLAIFPLFGSYWIQIGIETPSYADYFPSFLKKIIWPPTKEYPPLIQPTEKTEKNLKIGKNSIRLQNFFKKLKKVEEKKDRVIRIIHYGDSLIANDYVTLDFKKNLQKEFGDGGRGLVPITKSIKITGRNMLEYKNATRYSDFKWDAIEPHRGLKQGYTNPNLGFLGESYVPMQKNATIQIQIPDKIKSWQTADLYLRAPLDTSTSAVVEFSDDKKTVLKQVLLQAGQCKKISYLSDPFHKLSVRFKEFSQPPPFIDGLAMQTDFGVSYTSVSHVSMETNDRLTIPDTNFSCGMTLYQPDLIVYQFGVNEAQHMWVFSKRKPAVFKQNIKDVVQRVLATSPSTDVLIISPVERIRKNRLGQKITMPEMMTLRKIQKEVADELGVGFYDTYLATGGQGTNDRFYAKRYIMPDRIHLRRPGGKLVADLAVNDIISAYQKYKGVENKKIELEKRKLAEKLKEQQNQAINFNSPAYAFFLFAFFLILRVTSRFHWLRLLILLLASYYFYTSWNPSYLLLILFSTIVDYLTGLKLKELQQKGQKGNRYLVLSLSINLGLLFFFKYFQFIDSLLQEISFNGFYLSLPQNFYLPIQINGKYPSIAMKDIVLPVGISFYTFQTMSYTIDVWRREIPAESNFLKFSLYVSFFPQLVAGPIVRAKDFLTALKNRYEHFQVNPFVFSMGIFLIFQGLIKKNFADWLASNLVDGVFHNPDLYGSIDILFAIYGYGIQIFGDFSGYSDIAIGSAMILGFSLTKNFERPYLSTSITEFWQRWHISLGRWFLYYLYIPLGGNRKMVYRNLLITMFLCGLWHGAGISFIIWGMFHGVLLAIERIFSWNHKAYHPFWKFFKTFLTLHLVLFGWIIFRSENWQKFSSILNALFYNTNQFTSEIYIFLVIVFCYSACFFPDSWFKKLKKSWLLSHPLALGMISAWLSLLLYNLKIQDIKPFIYFQF